MTQIGAVTIDVPVSYSRSGYRVSLFGGMYSEGLFTSLKELFELAEYGIAIHEIRGDRPFVEDMTADSLNIQYCTFTHGTGNKPQDGYYALLPSFIYVDDESPEGHHYTFTINLFFIGTTSTICDCLLVLDLEDVTNDWDM